MKTEQYKALEKKYLEGKTTLEEERLLKEHSEEGLFHSLKTAKEETMDWDFNDFLNKAEKGKVIPISSNQNNRIPKAFWLAASVILLFGLAIGYQFWKPSTEINQTTIANNNSIEETNMYVENNIMESDSAAMKNPMLEDSTSIKTNTSTIKEIDINQIVPKRGRIKKTNKERMAKNERQPNNNNENKITEPTPKAPEKPEYQDAYVVINGQKIENQEEAINVAKYSIQMLSNKMSQTVAQTSAIESMALDY